MVGVVTSEFEGFARQLLGQRNAASLPLVTVQHPVGGIPEEQVAARITDDVVAAIAMALQNEQLKAAS